MSWNFSAGPIEQTNIRNAIEAAAEAAPAPEEAVAEEVSAQIEAAINAAELLVESGAIGDGNVNVTLSGHARAGNAEQAGSATDTISVSLSRAS